MRGAGYGLIGDVIVGVLGAVIGGFLASTFLNMPDAIHGINVTTIIVAFVGAVLLIGILRAIAPSRRRIF
jgi:uncharacterized membrane protein YeaQ/YmgE (transglycosylase-associated protein family)